MDEALERGLVEMEPELESEMPEPAWKLVRESSQLSCRLHHDNSGC